MLQVYGIRRILLGYHRCLLFGPQLNLKTKFYSLGLSDISDMSCVECVLWHKVHNGYHFVFKNLFKFVLLLLHIFKNL